MPDEEFTQRLTPRLRLTRMGERHTHAFAAYRADPVVARYQSWETFSLEDAHAFVSQQVLRHPDTRGEWFQLAVEERASGALVGDCAMGVNAGDPRLAEIGYTIAPAHQRRGYGVEAVRALLRYAFEERGKHRITATTDARNAASIALLERVGMRREGHFRQNTWFKGAWGDELLYALLDDEWSRAST